MVVEPVKRPDANSIFHTGLAENIVHRFIRRKVAGGKCDQRRGVGGQDLWQNFLEDITGFNLTAVQVIVVSDVWRRRRESFQENLLDGKAVERLEVTGGNRDQLLLFSVKSAEWENVDRSTLGRGQRRIVIDVLFESLPRLIVRT